MKSELALYGGERVRNQPFHNWPVFDATEEQNVLAVLRSGKWGRLSGNAVAEFEQHFAAMHGCRHGIAIVNGTVSLRIALMAAGIQADDEVIVPPYTFLSTASAVIESNAIPVFADIELETFNLDPRAVEAAITPRTRAIIPVHFAGQPVDMDAIMAVAGKHGLIVIEDAAHAHGAAYKGRPAGSIGHFGSFSFQSSKNLTSGEGGLITTSDDAYAEACRSIHNCGRIPSGVWYEHHVVSGNYRLSEFQGAILNAQLNRLEEQTRRRDENGQYLAARLARIPGCTPSAALAVAPAIATICSFCVLTPRNLALRAPPFLKRWPLKAYPRSGVMDFRCTSSPCFGTKPSDPISIPVTSGSITPGCNAPSARKYAANRRFGSSRASCWATPEIWTTSCARSRRFTPTARSWRKLDGAAPPDAACLIAARGLRRWRPAHFLIAQRRVGVL